MKLLITVLLLVFSAFAQAQTFDLRSYFPDNVVHTYNKADGSVSSRYTLQRSLPGAPTGVDSLYAGYMNLGKAGTPYVWRKEYFRNNAWCTDTYAVLLMGDDQSVTETGDWFSSTPCTPNVALGYKTSTGVNTGLVWAPAGGILPTAAIAEMDVWRQNAAGAAYANSGTKAYSKVGFIEHLDEFTPAYGRDSTGTWGKGSGKTYYDVMHIVMYHGTKTTGVNPVRCVGPISAKGAYYQSYKDYDSYAIELWIAKDVGIIQENTPFIENAGFWGLPNCTGDIFQYTGQWSTYIDQQ
jgi:hypothetical protein